MAAMICIALFGCSTSQTARNVDRGSQRACEDVAKEAVMALARGDGELFSKVAHRDLTQTMRKFMFETVKANPRSELSVKTLKALRVSTADEVQLLNNDQFNERAIKTPFFNMPDSPRTKLTGERLRVLRSYYLNGAYEVILQGEGKVFGYPVTNTVTVYVRRQNLDWRYYGDPSLFVITAMPKEIEARDMAIDLAEKGDYVVREARNAQRVNRGWDVLIIRQHRREPEPEAVTVFVSEDLKRAKLKSLVTGSVSDDLSRSRPAKRPFGIGN